MLHIFKNYHELADKILIYLNINYLLNYYYERYSLIKIYNNCHFYNFLFLSKEYNKYMKELLMRYFIYNKYIWFSESTYYLYDISDIARYQYNINIFNKSRNLLNKLIIQDEAIKNKKKRINIIDI